MFILFASNFFTLLKSNRSYLPQTQRKLYKEDINSREVAYHQDQIKEAELYQMMNPLYQLNAMMSPFYRMYGMDPMTAVMHPYLMGNYRNPFLAGGVTPLPGQMNAPLRTQLGSPQSNRIMRDQSQGYDSGFGPAGASSQGFNPISNPGISGSLQAMGNPGMSFSNNMPVNGIMNPFINTAGMMNPYMNRSGANPYYALTGDTDTMIGSPFNNYGSPMNGRGLLYRMSAMNPFVLGNLGLGSPFLNSGVGPRNPYQEPSNNHSDLDGV